MLLNVPAQIQRQFESFPVFFRWKTLFSSLPTRPFLTGVAILLAWMLVFRFTLHPLHRYLDHVFGRIFPYSVRQVSLPSLLLDYLVITPWLETLTFQKGVFAVAKWVRLTPSCPQVAIFLSAILFAASHFQSVGYIVYTILPGCLFGAAYFYGGGNRRMFWMVVLVHSVFNGICLAIQVIEPMMGISGW